MGVLQKSLEETVAAEYTREKALRGAIRNAAEISGFKLSETELDRAVAAFEHAAESGKDRVSFAGDTEEPRFIGDEALQAGLKKYMHDFEKTLCKAFPKIVESAAPSVLRSLYDTAEQAIADHRRLKTQFRRALRARWREGLYRMEMLLIIVQEAHNNAIAEFHAPGEKHTRNATLQFEALIRLHSKACRTLAEIHCLLESGHADGANARWRSLHEIAVTSYFLSTKPANVSRRYLEHEFVEQWKAARQFQAHAPALGYEPYSAVEMKSLQKKRDLLIQKYGQEFESDYGWAAKITGNPRPTFSQIEHLSGFAKWRPFYRLACHSIHAGSRGSNFSLGSAGDEGARFLFASNAGLYDPGHCSAISMTLATTALLTKWSNFDHLVTLRVMQQLTCEIADAFLAADTQLESEIVEADKRND